MSSHNVSMADGSIPTPNASVWECALLGFSALLAFVAWDNNFNMQVLAPTIILLAIGYFAKTRGSFADKRMLQICILILGVCAIGMLNSLALDDKIISTKSIIRFSYISLILLFFYVAVDRHYTRQGINLLVLGNISAGTAISVGVIGRYLSGASGKIAITNIWGIPLEENYMASLLAFELVLSVIAIRYTKDTTRKIALCVSTSVILLGIMLSGSRAALLGGLAGVTLFLFLYLIGGSVTGFVVRLLGLLILAAGVFFIIATVNNMVPVWYLDRFFHNSYFDSSNMQRLRYWSFGIQGYFNRPLFGYGIGNFAYYVNLQPWSGGGDVVVAHNTYIDALVDTGILGFILFAVLVIRNFKSGWKSPAFVALLFVAFFTSFIVGGERTFFFWNSVIMLSIFGRYIARGDNISTSTKEIFDLSSKSKVQPVEKF